LHFIENIENFLKTLAKSINSLVSSMVSMIAKSKTLGMKLDLAPNALTEVSIFSTESKK